MRSLSLAVALLLLLSGCGEKSEVPAENQKPVVKIGATLPLSGNLAMYGQALQKALDLALEDQKTQNLKYDYQLVIEDDGYDLKKVQTNLSRFKSVENVNAVMSFWGNAGTLVSDWAEKNKMIHMSCACSDKVGNGYYNFNHATQPQTHLKRILKYYRDNHFKKIGFAYLQALEIQEFIDNAVPLLKKEGFEVVFVMPFNPSQRDFKTEILKMKEKQPDVVEVLMNSPLINIFGKQAKELGFNVPMSSINNMTDALEEYEGQTFVAEDMGSDDFTRRFEEKAGTKQTACVVNFYDGLRMMIDAFEKTELRAGQKVPQEEDVVKTMLKNRDYQSVLAHITIDEEGNIDSASVLKRIINGVPVEVSE